MFNGCSYSNSNFNIDFDMSIDNLIKDMQELKKTKLYASSFKAIDDCIFLAEYQKKEERKQIIDTYIRAYNSAKKSYFVGVQQMAEQYYKDNYENNNDKNNPRT